MLPEYTVGIGGGELPSITRGASEKLTKSTIIIPANFIKLFTRLTFHKRKGLPPPFLGEGGLLMSAPSGFY
jgi:hypothetical protein